MNFAQQHQDQHVESPDLVQPREGLIVTRYTDISLATRMVHLIIRPFRGRLVKPQGIKYHGPPRLTPPRKASRRCSINERRVSDISIYDLTARDDGQVSTSETVDSGPQKEKKRRKRIYYFAGGGWQMPPTKNHWAFVAEMARKIPDTTVSLVAYPLVPNFSAATSMVKLREAYDILMEESSEKGESVIFMGDSAGGNIALALVTWALETPGAKAPDAVMAICPTTDLRHLDPDIHKTSRHDPIMTVSGIQSTAQAWAAGQRDASAASNLKLQQEQKHNIEERVKEWDASDPRVSPILANLSNLVTRGVKVHGVTGTYDILAVEAKVFRDRCAREGVEGEWLEWEGQMHCFPLAFRSRVKESVRALEWIIERLGKV